MEYNVKEKRLSIKLTQNEFAKAIGVHTVTVGMWETGKQQPSLRNQRKIDKLIVNRLKQGDK